MARLHTVLLLLTIILMASSGCSGTDNPISGQPTVTPSVQTQPQGTSDSSTHLWAYCDVYLDTENANAEAVINRTAEFTVNTTGFLNSSVSNLSFGINEIISGTDYVDIDIDVTLRHPFPGLPQYDGYDVRGVFMGDGSATLVTGGGAYPTPGTDQIMLPDPDDGVGGPDGYTRWFNQTEFSTGGMPLFQYIHGNFSTPDYVKTATLNAYKYFADGLGSDEDLFSWLQNNSGSFGDFSSGAVNTRNYYLRFPSDQGVVFGYAVIASWQGTSDDDHPANANEAVACSIEDSSTVYYENASSNGGDLVLDLSLWEWHGVPLNIFVESTVLENPHQLSASEMIPVSGDDYFSTWHVDIAADNVNGVDENEFWIIAQYDDDYGNDFGVGNLIENEPLAAYFRYGLDVSNTAPGDVLVTAPNGGEELVPGEEFEITWISTISGNVSIEYSKDDFTSDINLIASDEPNDGSYSWTVPCDPSSTCLVRVSMTSAPSFFDDSDDYFTINGGGWARTWGVSPSFTYCGASGMAVDPDGNVFTSGKYNGLVDFDPGPTVENHDTNGGYDVYISKYSNCGEYLWTRTIGGSQWENTRAVAVDSDGSVYMVGDFAGTVDFDPDPVGVENKSGTSDAFLVKLDSSGDFEWVRTWGSPSSDFSYDVTYDESGYMYVTGWFSGTVNFDGTGGSDVKIAAGIRDSFLTKYDTDGNYVWTKTWGSTGFESGTGVDVDSSGNAYCTGWFENTVDFDPGPDTESYTAAANPGLYLTKFDSSGNHVWARTWGGSHTNNYDFAPDICVAGSDVVVCARYVNTVDFDPGPGVEERTSNGDQDVCVSKFDTDGDFYWVNAWGGSVSYETGRGVAIDDDGSVYISAEFAGTVDLDPDPDDVYNVTSNGSLDLSLSKFDSTGDLLWVRTWGGFGADRPGLVDLDPMGNVFMAGYFRGSNVEFAPTASPCFSTSDPHSADGESDSLIVKYHPDGCW